jgi:hypothetical protein
MQEPFTTTDAHDKRDPSIQFTPPVHYTPEEVEAGNKLVEIINNPTLSEADKKAEVWEVLNNVTAPRQ